MSDGLIITLFLGTWMAIVTLALGLVYNKSLILRLDAVLSKALSALGFERRDLMP